MKETGETMSLMGMEYNEIMATATRVNSSMLSSMGTASKSFRENWCMRGSGRIACFTDEGPVRGLVVRYMRENGKKIKCTAKANYDTMTVESMKESSCMTTGMGMGNKQKQMDRSMKGNGQITT